MTEFFIHFFPLATIFLFLVALIYFIRYMNSFRKIENHMSANRPEEWDEMGKPSILAKLVSEKRSRFKTYLEAEHESDDKDQLLVKLWERSKRLKKMLSITEWSAVGMYFLSIFMVNFLLGKFD